MRAVASGLSPLSRRRACTSAVVAAAAVLAGCAPQHAERDVLLDPGVCAGCHPNHFNEWSGSMHAYAAEDPVFRAMNQKGQRETNGALGSFCVNCHAPMAVREAATTDGLNLDSVPKSLHGVTCYFCHSTDSVEGTHDNPLREAPDFTMRGPFKDPVKNPIHLSAYSTLHDRDELESSSLCGACHDIETGHGASLERTFAEWKASVFNRAPGGVTCGQCHQPQSRSLEAVATATDAPQRRRHGHSFAGIDVALTGFPNREAQRGEIQTLLDSTLQSGLCVSEGAPRIRVLLDNVAAGHSFPSGASQDRRVWAEVTAYSQGAVIYRSGDVAEGTTERRDADQWLLRDCTFDAAGNEVHDFWNVASYDSNALPAQVTFDPLDARFFASHVVRVFPRASALPVPPDRVTLELKVRPISLDVIDALVASGDLDAGVRAAVPTFTLGKVLEWTPDAGRVVGQDMGQPVSCVSASGLTLASTTVPAPEHTRCSP